MMDEAMRLAVAALDAGGQRTVSLNGAHFVVTALAETGIHSGRRRHCVACLSCETLLHEATTGWESRISGHRCRGAR